MHEIQMLGLLEHDVLSSIEVPFLPDYNDPYATPQLDTYSSEDAIPTKAQADKADLDTFTLTKASRPLYINRNSFASSSTGSGTVVGSSSYRSTMDKRPLISHRTTRIAPIEESPRRIIAELPPEGSPSPSRPVSIFNKTPTATFNTSSTLHLNFQYDQRSPTARHRRQIHWRRLEVSVILPAPPEVL